MNRYQLAKIVEWAGQLRTRKRLQKVVFMLQAAGCPLDAEYTLHHYGPYSQEVARISDEMVKAQLLLEKTTTNMLGEQYSYSLSERVPQQMRDIEGTPQGKLWNQELSKFEALGRELLDSELKSLEYASTIVYFLKQGLDWTEAIDKACSFKGTPTVRNAEPLARKVMD